MRQHAYTKRTVVVAKYHGQDNPLIILYINDWLLIILHGYYIGSKGNPNVENKLLCQKA